MDRIDVIKNRFWSKVTILGEDDCWEWTAGKTKGGYGVFGKYKELNTSQANRISYLFTYGEFDNSLVVCHKCDNPSCVNPNHLFTGTQSDNLHDMSNKGRHWMQVHKDRIKRGRDHHNFGIDLNGDKNPNARLNWNDVGKIRDLYKNGKTVKEISQIFSVAWQTIKDIVVYDSWIPLEDEY